jgi:hypothetical protein
MVCPETTICTRRRMSYITSWRWPLNGRRRTDKTMTKRKGTSSDLQNGTTLRRKLKIEQHEPKNTNSNIVCVSR